MITPSSERGLSEVLGAILMFALVFSLLVIVQVWAVPAANAQVELEHSLELEAGFGELSEGLDRVTLVGSTETSSLQAGVRYPSRIFLLNPPPASYTISASEVYSGGTSISNIEAINTQTNEYFASLPVAGTLSYDTQSFSLSTEYNQYTESPVFHIEGGMIYKKFPNQEVSFVDEGNIVNGRTITLVSLEGDISSGGSGTISLPMVAQTGPMQTVSVTNLDDANIPISVPTDLSTSDWEQLLEPQYRSRGGYVVDGSVQVDDGDLTFELAKGFTYDIRLSKVRFGQRSPSDVGAAYITPASGDTDRRVTGASDFSVQVRDRFNNPVSGVEVTFSANTGKFERTDTLTDSAVSDENGMATVRYDPVDQNTVVKATIPGAKSDEPDPKRVHFNVKHVGSTEGDGTNKVNPYTGNLVLVKAEPGDDDKTLVMTLVNKNDETLTITGSRVAFFYQAAPGDSGSSSPITAEIRTTTPSETSELMVIGRDLVPISDVAVGSDETVEVTIEFFTDTEGSDTYGPPNADDFFVLSLLFDEGETSATYYVQGDSYGLDLLTASASDLGVSDEEEQTLEFDLGRNLESGETVTIDLSNAQDEKKVDYSASSVDDNAGGQVTIDASGKSATVTYTADGSEKAGSSIIVTVSGIDTSGDDAPGTYDVDFTGPEPSGQELTVTFEVS